MPESLLRIHRHLDALGRRARGFLVLRAVFLACAGWAWGVAALAAIVNLQSSSARHGAWWVAAAALVGVMAAGWVLRGWGASGDRRVLAERVETAESGLRGELLTVLDRFARPLGSPALLDRLARQAGERAEAVPVAVVVPVTPVRRSASVALLSGLLLMLLGVLLPVGPVEAVQLLLAPPVTTTQEAPKGPEGPHALVGDITLRYLYPTYTRLEPLEVPNSSGEVRAPPGTRVEIRARTAVAYEAAALEVYGQPGEPVELTGGRDLAAALVVAGEGVWRFRFGDLPSPDYRIVPDADLAPDVSVDVPRRQLTLAVDDRLPLRWAAKDDYGITRVVFEVQGKGGTREVELRKPLDVPRQLSDAATITAADLGLHPGDMATLRVKAWDNDGVSGEKPGYSAPVELEVVGPNGSGERAMENRQRLRDALVKVLADFLVEPSPAFRTGAEGPAWSVAANTRYDELDKLTQEIWGGVEGSGVDYTAVSQVSERRRALTAYARAASGGALSSPDLVTLQELQASHIEAVEGAILLFDEILRMAAAKELAELAKTLAEDAAQLQKDFAGLSKEQILARLDQLARFLTQLQARAAKLGDDQLGEFVNQRADQLGELMDQIRKAEAAGRTEEARALMQRLAEQMQDLADGLQEAQKQRGAADDKMSKAMDELQAELKKLGDDQAALRKQTEAAREKFGGDMDRAAKAWEDLEKRAQAVVDADHVVTPLVSRPESPPSLGRFAQDARDEAEGLLDSIRARDLEKSIERVDRATYQAEGFRDAVESMVRRLPSAANDLAAVRPTAHAQPLALRDIRKKLEEMQSNREESSPELQRALRQLAEQQQQIEERAQKAAEQSGQIAKSLPMKAPGLERGAKSGAEQAARAAEGLQAGDPMESVGGQQAAEDGFREALDALNQAKQNLAAMQQAGKSGGKGDSPGDKPQDGKGGDQTSPDPSPMLLPAPEEFQTPEAYRNALLEGMSGQVPDEYKTLNRRYYEELVRQ